MAEGKKLIVVDDDEVLLFVVNKQLSNEESIEEVITFENSENAFSELEKEDYSLGLIDINMPGQNGWEFAKKCRNNNIHTPLAIMSALIREEDRVKLDENSNVVGLLEKPVDIKQLLKLIEKVDSYSSL